MKPETLSTVDASAKARPEKRFVVFQADEGLISLIDDYAKATQVSRSWVIRAVLQGWMADKKPAPGEP